MRSSRLRGNAHRELVRFEKLLSEMSASFVRVSVDDIDSEIERWLQQIVLALRMDRGTVGEFNQLDQGIYITHQWARRGVTTPDVGQDVRFSMPWSYGRLFSGKLLTISKLDEFPPEAAEERNYARLNGGACTIAIPIKIGETIVGAVSFGKVGSERKWTKNLVQRLKLSTEIFGNALERKRAEAEIRRLAEEAQRVSQVVAISELTTALADELRQPLTAIMSNAEAMLPMLDADAPDISELKSTARDIIADNRRVTEIVRNVHVLCKQTAPNRSSVDIRDLLRNVHRLVSGEARRRGVSLGLSVPDTLPYVVGDNAFLARAVLNLVLSALDSVCNVSGPRKIGLFAALNENNTIRVSIRDSGEGIDAKKMPNLLKPLTTKSVSMDMGLAVTSSIIRDHGGRLWARQNADRGATFEFELPLEKRSAKS